MRLSIIIVNWNTRDMLRECLRSVFRRIDPERDEVFVVDNGSVDGSADLVAREFPAVRLIRNPDNRGFAAANNQALRLAGGRYALLLNNDTLVHGDVLTASCRYLDRHADVGVLGCRVLNDDGSLQLTCSRYPTFANLLLLTTGLAKLPWPAFLGRYQMAHWKRDDERDVDTVSGCYMMVRRDAIREVGLLDEAFFFFGEETDWCRRFHQAGWRVRFAPVGCITHFGSVSGRRLNHRRDVLLSNAMVRLHRKHGGRIDAGAVWLLLLGFNASRAAFWSLRALLAPRPEATGRRAHFMGVVREFAAAWPKAEGSST